MIFSYFVGQKYYPINYPLKSIGAYVALAVVLFAAMTLLPLHSAWMRIGVNTLLIGAFVGAIIRWEHFRLPERFKLKF